MSGRCFVPAMMVGLGVVLFGIALGLVYLDVRAIEIAFAQAEAAGEAVDSDDVFGGLEDVRGIWFALLTGPLGAGMVVTGGILLIMDFFMARRGEARG